jgi:predicted TIM-barrel fold metal-dependent hydrolase
LTNRSVDESIAGVKSIEELDLENGRSVVRGTITYLPEPEARELWCPIISVDDHSLEPADLFATRVPAALRDRAPRVVEDDDGVPVWLIGDDREYMRMTTCGAVGRPMAEWSLAPQKYEEFRAGVYDTDARVRDMDLNGVWASQCFPSFVFGFAGRRLNLLADAEVALASVRAYNDWHLGEWCGSHPDRFIACQLPWLRDPVVGAEEIRRNAAAGFRSVSFPENPEALGFPHIYTDHWDPILAACEETGTVLNLHVGSSGLVQRPCSASPIDVGVALFPVGAILGLVDWVFSKIPVRFPGLKIAMSEGGVSWVPMALERLARSYRQAESSLVWRVSDPDPVEIVHRNFWFTSIEDPSAFRFVDLIGEDKVMIESDYPHADSTWPDTQALVRRDLGDIDPVAARKICFGNAAALYRHPEPPADLVARSVVGVAEPATV